MKEKHFDQVIVKSTISWISQPNPTGMYEDASFGESTPSLSARVVWHKENDWLQVDFFPGLEMFVVNASGFKPRTLWKNFLYYNDLESHNKLGTSAWDLCVKFAAWMS